MTVTIDWEADLPDKEAYEALVRRVVEGAVDYEECPYECDVSVLFTDGIAPAEFQTCRSGQIVPDAGFMFLYTGNDQFAHISVFTGNVERIRAAAVKIAVHPHSDQSEIIQVSIEIWHNLSSQAY